MATGKERLRRWRERNRAAGKQSVTIMLSPEATAILRDEKAASGETYSTIIEQVLLHNKKNAAPVPSHHAPKKPKLLIDEDGTLRGESEREVEHQGNHTLDNHRPLETGFIPRLLKRSNNRMYKLGK